MSAPEESQPFREVRAAHRQLRRVVNDQNRQIREAATRERQMRLQLERLPELAVKACVDVIRRRGDLSMAQALSLVAEVFTAE